MLHKMLTTSSVRTRITCSPKTIFFLIYLHRGCLSWNTWITIDFTTSFSHTVYIHHHHIRRKTSTVGHRAYPRFAKQKDPVLSASIVFPRPSSGRPSILCLPTLLHSVRGLEHLLYPSAISPASDVPCTLPLESDDFELN